MNKPLKVVVDENMPGLELLLGDVAQLIARPGRQIRAADLHDADALLVRSVTRVDEALLADSDLRFVGTATIGTDHLDTAWLEAQGIEYASAPGCNAEAVCDYVLAVLVLQPALLERLLSRQARVAVIGLGNVGGRVARRLQGLGMDVVGVDPFVSHADLTQVTLSKIAGCSVVCCHAPLTRRGRAPTFHLLDEALLDTLADDTLLISAGRGAVVDNQALKLRQRRSPLSVALDVWEPEPALDRELLAQVQIATPHIAGYSLDGKWRGSAMVARALRRSFGLPQSEHEMPLPEVVLTPPEEGLRDVAWLAQVVLQVYNPQEDDQRLRREAGEGDWPVGFDRLRKNYPLRRELRGALWQGRWPAGTRRQHWLHALGIRPAQSSVDAVADSAS